MNNKKIQVIYKDVDELIPYINNPRLNDNAVDAVASSIKNFGFKNPIVIDSDNEIINGHTRLKAAKKLGLDTVPVIIADDLTEAQKKAFRLADNKVSEIAEWDIDMLELELNELSDLDIDIDMEEFGFEVIENIKSEEADELKDLYESDLGPYDKAHYLITILNKDKNKIESIIEKLEEMDDVELKQSRCKNG